ncbi:MAG: tetratricopeptide repeat protein [Bacteroidetes bacterium]|nr:tetratricopeptide repeat protein [Bacteroidota bacterium]
MNIPSGKVTFLFTDIEGSTKLAQKDNKEYLSSLDKHNVILNQIIKDNGGFIFKMIGDAFCSAFHSAEDAVKASVSIQTRLQEEQWNESVIRIRIGIHTGKSEWNGTDYMGYVTLAKTQRVMSAAWGGQILVSNESYEAASERGTGKISFRDLGERRLKDLTQPVKIFQVISDNIPSEFPPLNTLDVRPNNLPQQLTGFIGREEEITDIKKLLSEARMLSILGSGGTGKTRISLQAAAELIDDFENGVWVTVLAPITEPALIPSAIVRSLGASGQAGEDSETTLLNYLKDKELLLILDNCEHLIEACAQTAETILKKSKRVKIIATSREALKIDGEILYRLSSLSVPDPKKKISLIELSKYEAVRLFIERALSVNSEFRINPDNAEYIAEICRNLDGIPLAIELAAARTKIMSPKMICDKLGDRFRLLTGGNRTALPRQQTLRAMIDWSYDLLSDNEKLLFQRLSVFSGGWTFESAEEICEDEKIDTYEMLDTHSNLLDKSLINKSENSGAVRFYLLETVKQYAAEKLGSDPELSMRHFEYFSRSADNSANESKDIDQLNWLSSVDSELDNFRTALQWASLNEPDRACKFLDRISDFWRIKGYYSEGIETVKKIFEPIAESGEINRAKVMAVAGQLHLIIGNTSESEKYIEESLKIFTKNKMAKEIATCYNLLGQVFYTFKTDYTKAIEVHEKALEIYRELNDKTGIASSLYLLSFPVSLKGEAELAFDYKLEALGFYRELNDSFHICLIETSLGVVEYRRHNIESARNYTEKSLEISQKLGNKFLQSINLINMGCIFSELKEFEKAENLIDRSLVLIKENGYTSNLLAALMYKGYNDLGAGNTKKAVYNFKKSVNTGREAGIGFFLLTNIYGIGEAFYISEDYENSFKYFTILSQLLKENNDPLGKVKIEDAGLKKDEIKKILGDSKCAEIRNEIISLNRDEILDLIVKDLPEYENEI